MGNNEIKKLDDSKISEISGGRTGLFKKPEIFKTYCDYCNEHIDGKARFEIPINVSGKTMCNQCFEKQKSILGTAAATERWLGIKAPVPTDGPSSAKIKIDIKRNKK